MRIALIATVAIFAGMTYETAYSETAIMPQELIEFAEKNNCTQLSDFFDSRPGRVNPPYVYGYLPGDEENSAVFWCKNTEPSKHPFSLSFVVRDSEGELRQLSECPFKIEWDNPPRGLSVYKNRRTTLKGFVYLDNPKRKVPENVRLSHNGIRSYYDGIEALFYCHEGKWLVSQSD